MGELVPIRRQVVVRGAAASAFEVFTAEVGAWWPMGVHSVYGKDATVAFAGERLVERGPEGDEAVWGEVLDWDPPSRLRITWHPGSDPAKASEVEVTFAELPGDQVLVTLEHRGWERFTDPVAARAEYNRGWPHVLAGYADLASSETPVLRGEGPLWLALLHTEGPALPDGESIFAQPDFAEHVAFLQRLEKEGVLVAAGPIDLPGMATGMTVIRVPDPADAATYVRMAHEDDQSVVRGLLQVRVQPWHVQLTGAPVDAGA
jgi:uncharacterized protein YndB with AHSA1/START domain/uncharacterized protein YciI